MQQTKYQGSWPCGFRLEVFLHSLCKTCDPRDGPIIGPTSII